jgi:hypothetical protein
MLWSLAFNAPTLKFRRINLCSMLLICLLLTHCLMLCGCGGGVGGGTSGSLSTPLQTGSVTVQVAYPGKVIPPGTDHFAIKVFNPGGTAPVITPVVITYPQTSAVVSGIPVGWKMFSVVAYDVNGKRLAFGVFDYMVQPGNNNGIEVELQVGSGLQHIVKINSSNEFADVATILTSPEPLESSFRAKVDHLTQTQLLNDLGPGGANASMNYNYGNTHIGYATFFSRGTGSYFTKNAPLAEVTGLYHFELSELISGMPVIRELYDIDCPYEYPTNLPVLQTPPPYQIGQTYYLNNIDFSNPVNLSWAGLGNDYVYNVMAVHYPGNRNSKTTAGNMEIQDVTWTTNDIRNINYNNLNTLNDFINNLSSTPSATIPAGIFVSNGESLKDVKLDITAFKKPLLLSDSGAVVQTAHCFAIINPSFQVILTGLSPTSGPVGTPVTLLGSNFGPNRSGSGSYVSFNGGEALDYPLWSDTRIICFVPPSATSGPVTVHLGSGQVSNSINFTVTARAWQWQNPLPTGNSIYAVWGSSANDVFAVGKFGTILHYNGSQWSQMDNLFRTDLYGVWGNSSNDVYAAGASGTILHYDGNYWSLLDIPFMVDFEGVWGSAANDLYAVGDDESGGYIYHFNGSAWEEVYSLPNCYCFNIWGAAANSIFVLAYDNLSGAMMILKYNGSSWGTTLAPGDTYLDAVAGSGPNDVYAVGYDEDNEEALIMHYNGSSWSKDTRILRTKSAVEHRPRRLPPGHHKDTRTLRARPDAELYGIAVNSANNIFAVGENGLIMHFNGSSWSEMVPPEYDYDLYGVWGNFTGGVYGTLLHYNGSEWEAMNHSLTSVDLRGVWGSAYNNVYAVGGIEEEDSGKILHYNGGNWELVPGNFPPLAAIWGSSANDVFAVGGGFGTGAVYHYNGSDWSDLSPATGEELRGVWGSGPNDVFVVGSSGAIFHYNGNDWSAMSSGTGEWLKAVWGSGPNDVFVVGSSGTILHYNGADWSAMSSGIARELEGVWGSSTADVFAVGEEGTILHYNGLVWQPMSSGTPEEYLTGVWGNSSDDVYVVGSRGMILHYDGYAWNPLNNVTFNWLFGVSGIPNKAVFVVGEYGTILKY